MPHLDWRVFHDPHWPHRRLASVNHVVVGPSGVFVIDVRDWDGEIEVEGGTLRVDGQRREWAVTAAREAAQTLGAKVSGLEPSIVRPVLCLARSEPVFGWAGDVMVCSTANLVSLMTARPVVLSSTCAYDVAKLIQVSLQSISWKSAVEGVYRSERAQDIVPRTWPLLRRFHEVPMTRRSVALVAAAVVGLAGFGGFRAGTFDGFPDRVTSQFVTATPGPPVAAGTALTLAGSDSLPELEVTQTRAQTVQPNRASQGPQKGKRLWGVHLQVRNRGTTPLPSPLPLHATVVDDRSVLHVVAKRVTSLDKGRMLAMDRPVPAGKSVSGYVVFELPRGTQIAEVRVQAGSGTARWKLGR